MDLQFGMDTYCGDGPSHDRYTAQVPFFSLIDPTNKNEQVAVHTKCFSR